MQFDPASSAPPDRSAWRAFRLRWKRRRYLFRLWRKRREITRRVDRTPGIRPGAILCFVTLRNESLRLPHFLAYYRALGVDHFLVVDNGSTDGSTALLTDQPDVSLWSTAHSYRRARFGMDWLGWLQIVHGHGHWCLTVDADELLVFPRPEAGLRGLTEDLDARGAEAMGALMVELYPRGPLGAAPYRPGDDPLRTLTHFDADNYRSIHHPTYENLYIQGGVRERAFFAADPARAPTLNKVPLVKWNRRYVYVSSMHQMLPPRLNRVFPAHGAGAPTGVLLHTKFLPTIAARSAEEMARREHFENSDLYRDYYEALMADPVLWHDRSERYTGWRQLVGLGLMSDPGRATRR